MIDVPSHHVAYSRRMTVQLGSPELYQFEMPRCMPGVSENLLHRLPGANLYGSPCLLRCTIAGCTVMQNTLMSRETCIRVSILALGLALGFAFGNRINADPDTFSNLAHQVSDVKQSPGITSMSGSQLTAFYEEAKRTGFHFNSGTSVHFRSRVDGMVESSIMFADSTGLSHFGPSRFLVSPTGEFKDWR